MTITNLSTLLLIFSFLLQKGISFRNLFLYRTISSKLQQQQQRSVNQHFNIMSPQAKLNLQTTTTTTTTIRSLNTNSIQTLQNQNNEQFPKMDETFDRLVAKLRPYAEQSNEQQQQLNKQLWVGIAGGPGSGTFQQQLQFHGLKNYNYF
jgi:hypothetical protein